jgi:hypothetical protein
MTEIFKKNSIDWRRTLSSMPAGETIESQGYFEINRARTIASRLKGQNAGVWEIVLTDEKKTLFSVTRIT